MPVVIGKLETKKIERQERKEQSAKGGTNPTHLFHFILAKGERWAGKKGDGSVRVFMCA